MPLSLLTYDHAVGPRDLGEAWALTKEGQTLVLVVRTHPDGWELCLRRGDQVVRTDVCRRQERVPFLAERWRLNAERADWTVMRSDSFEVPAANTPHAPRSSRRK